MQPKLPAGWESWQLEELLGEGSYGSVYKASRNLGGSKLYSAIKIIRIPSSENEIRAMILETGSKEAASAYYGDMAKECIQEIAAMNTLKSISAWNC